jgi:hypothetical protein
MRCSRTLVLVAFLVACDHRVAPASSSTTAAASGSPAPAASSSPPSPCGDLPCTQHDSASEAFLQAAGPDPAVLAIGEAHAQKGSPVP